MCLCFFFRLVIGIMQSVQTFKRQRSSLDMLDTRGVIFFLVSTILKSLDLRERFVIVNRDPKDNCSHV